MHGSIATLLQRYVIDSYGADAWANILAEAGFPAKTYEGFQQYPDEEIVKLAATGARLLNRPLDEVLHDFGYFTVKPLFDAFAPLIDPSWRTLEFLENAEGVVHAAIRSRNRIANPPVLRARRDGPDVLTMSYDSPRKLGMLAVGLMKAVADYYDETIEVDFVSEMAKGDRADVWRVRRTSSRPAVKH